MRKLTKTDTKANRDVMELSRSISNRTGASVFLLVVGSILLLIGITILTETASSEPDSWAVFAVVIFLGSLLFMGGLYLNSCKIITGLDRGTGTLLKRTVFFTTIGRKHRPLSEFKTIGIRREEGLVAMRGQAPPVYYTVALIHKTNATKNHIMINASSLEEARKIGLEAAHFLNIALEDQVTGINLDTKNLQQAVETALPPNGIGGTAAIPRKPATMQAVIEEEEKQTAVRFPGQKKSAVPIALILSPAFCMIFYITIGWIIPMPYRIGAFFLIVVIIFYWGLVKSRKTAIPPTNITASRKELTVTTGEIGNQETVVLPVPEIKEFLLPSRMRSVEAQKLTPSRGILARSEKASAEFGMALSENELRYIYAMIHNALFRQNERRPRQKKSKS